MHERHGIGRRDDGGEPDGAGAGDGVEARADGAVQGRAMAWRRGRVVRPTRGAGGRCQVTA